MRLLFLVAVTLITACGPLIAVEKKPLEDVKSELLTKELQVLHNEDRHICVVWWTPVEFWEVAYTQDDRFSEEGRNEIVESLRPYSLLAVVQGDLSAFSALDFYSKAEVLAGLKVTYTTENGKKINAKVVTEPQGDVALLIEQFAPTLKQSMGQLGENFHFFAIRDRSEDGRRILDPYSVGSVTIETTTRKGRIIRSEIETPLNELHISRKCPNGRDAHVSWKFCPWTGEKLAE